LRPARSGLPPGSSSSSQRGSGARCRRGFGGGLRALLFTAVFLRVVSFVATDRAVRAILLGRSEVLASFPSPPTYA
jgi:hypothetical protein